MATTYRIANKTSGADLGLYRAETKWGAVVAMYREAGSELDLAEETYGETLIVAEIPDPSDDEIETFRAVAGAHGDRAMVETCDRALDGGWMARAKVAESIVSGGEA